jgi:hypothetical protein
MLFAFLGCLLWGLWESRTRFSYGTRFFRLAMLAGVSLFLTLAVYSPVLATSGSKSLFGNEYVAAVTLEAFPVQVKGTILRIVQFWFGGHASLLMLAAFLAFCGLFRLARHFPSGTGAVLAMLLSTSGLSLVMRRCPPARACVFLLPFLSVPIVHGIVLLFRAPREIHRVPVGVLVAVVVLLQACALRGNALALASQETGAFPDAESVCILVAPKLCPGDRFLVQGPSDGPLLYYMKIFGMPYTLLTAPLGTARHVWVLVNGAADQTLASVLAANNVVLSGYPERQRSRYPIGKTMVWGMDGRSLRGASAP